MKSKTTQILQKKIVLTTKKETIDHFHPKLTRIIKLIKEKTSLHFIQNTTTRKTRIIVAEFNKIVLDK